MPTVEAAKCLLFFRQIAQGIIGRSLTYLVVFKQRGINADDRSRELIESCADLDTLNS